MGVIFATAASTGLYSALREVFLATAITDFAAPALFMPVCPSRLMRASMSVSQILAPPMVYIDVYLS